MTEERDRKNRNFLKSQSQILNPLHPRPLHLHASCRCRWLVWLFNILMLYLPHDTFNWISLAIARFKGEMILVSISTQDILWYTFVVIFVQGQTSYKRFLNSSRISSTLTFLLEALSSKEQLSNDHERDLWGTAKISTSFIQISVWHWKIHGNMGSKQA